MVQSESPVVQRRRLRMELRRAREQAGKTQKEVVDALDWSLSKLIRIEGGSVQVSTSDLIALLRHYGATDREEELVEVARAGRKPAWWDKHRQHYSQQFLTFLGLEASAVRLRTFHGLHIPGLLQTREYVTAVMATFIREPERLVRGVEVRLKRQDLLDAASGPEMSFVVDEAALRRWVGGPHAMREQLHRLEELDRRPNITIQVLPFNAGAHPGMRGAFTIIDLPFDDEYAVLLEQAHRDVLIQGNPDEISTYLEIFENLEAVCTPKGEFRKFVHKVLEGMPDSDPVARAD